MSKTIAIGGRALSAPEEPPFRFLPTGIGDGLREEDAEIEWNWYGGDSALEFTKTYSGSVLSMEDEAEWNIRPSRRAA
jgi:hypothetical protein